MYVMNLLIVDDEIYAIEGIRLLLNWETYGVEKIFDATSIAEARDIFSRERIDMLLCDIELVEENGLDLLKWMNEEGHRAKTIFLTCHEVFGYAQRALQQGAVNYILKPARPESMIQAINQVKELLEKEEEDPIVELIKSCIPEKTEKSQFLKRLDAYLVENMEGDLSRNAIAAEMYLNPDYMGRLLKKETGYSLSEYIGKKKVMVASVLLRTTSIPIVDVAQRVGVQELSYFFRLFKKETGLTPKEFRNKYSEKGEDINAAVYRKKEIQ